MESITEKSIRPFEDKAFNKELLKYAIPIALQQLMISAVSVADTIMLGKLDQNCMSAVALAAQVQFIQNGIVLSIASVLAILISQYLGKKDMKSVDYIFNLGLKISGIVSLITFLLCEFVPEGIMKVYTNEPVLIEIGVRYLKIAGWSYLIAGVSQCYLCLIKVSEKAKYTAIITGTTVVLNIVLNAILIYGLLGFNSMAEEGAAIATLISRFVELVWCIGISFTAGAIKPSYDEFFTRNKLLTKDFFVQCIPLVAAYLLWSVGISSYSAFMGHLGLDAAAANSLSSTVREMTCFFCTGLAQGAVVVIGRYLGSGDLVNGKIAGIRVFKWAIVTCIAFALLLLALTPVTVLATDLTSVARKYLVSMMIVMSVYMIGRVFNTIIVNGIFEAGGDTKFDPISLFLCMWCLAVPLAALGTFVFNWSPILVCAMTCLDEVGKIPLVVHHYKKYKWVKDLTR